MEERHLDQDQLWVELLLVTLIVVRLVLKEVTFASLNQAHYLGIFAYSHRMVYFKNSSRVQMTQYRKINKPFYFSILD
jgi:hypothetical protein